MEKSSEDIQKLLSDPFTEGDIEWRVQASGVKRGGSPWVRVIPYITNRAIQQRLDDVFGVFGWENIFEEAKSNKGYLCGIKAMVGDKSVTKWDGAEYTNIESMKGGLSGSMKRAAVQFGIGRYLYNLEDEFATCKTVASRWNISSGANYIHIKKGGVDAEWFPPELPLWALPSAKFESMIEKINKASDLIILKGAYESAYKYANSFSRGDQVKEAIKAKDAQKLKLEIESNQEKSIIEQKTRVWLEREINDQILGAQNESVLSVNRKRLSEQLKNRCCELDIDVIELLSVLDKHYKNQLITLKP